MAWHFDSNQAVFLQIANRLRNDIIIGKYAPNEQLPTVRQLASEAAVNPNTVQKSLMLLEEEGLIYTRATVGRFITPDTSIILKARDKMRREAVRSWISQANALGITATEMVNYINECAGEEDISI